MTVKETPTHTGRQKHAEEYLLEVRTGGWERERLREDNREKPTRICVCVWRAQTLVPSSTCYSALADVHRSRRTIPYEKHGERWKADTMES